MHEYGHRASGGHISMDRRPAAKHAKDAGSAAVAMTAIATGVAWAVIIFDLLSR